MNTVSPGDVGSSCERHERLNYLIQGCTDDVRLAGIDAIAVPSRAGHGFARWFYELDGKVDGIRD